MDVLALRSANPLASRVGRFFRRFAVAKPSPELIERWREIEAQGAALERLMASPDWGAVQMRREVFQRLRDLVLHSPQATPEARSQAAMEWQALEGWFRDLTACVREGQKAREAMRRHEVTPT